MIPSRLTTHWLRWSLLALGVAVAVYVASIVSARASRGYLHRLASDGRLLELRAALADGADPNEVIASKERKSGGWTPLMMAAQSGQLECAEALIQAGANVNARDRFLKPTLAFAVDHSAVVALLLDHGAESDYCGRAVQYSAIARAVERQNVESVRLILEAGVDPDGECFRYVIFELLPWMYSSRVEDEVLASLLKHGAGRFRGQELELLHWAAESGAVGSAREILNQGASVDVADQDGQTALMLATSQGCIPLVQLLLDHGASVGRRDHEGRSPIEYLFDADIDQPTRSAIIDLLTKGSNH